MVSSDILGKLDIFSGLSRKELKALEGVSEEVHYTKGDIIFREYDEAQKLYVLLRGSVSIQFEVGHHQEAVVHVAGDGQALGWSALIQPYRFTASARCRENSVIVEVDRAGLKVLMDKDCYLGFVIMEKLAELVSMRLRETRLQLISMLHG